MTTLRRPSLRLRLVCLYRFVVFLFNCAMTTGLRYFANPLTSARPWIFDNCQTADLRFTTDPLINVNRRSCRSSLLLRILILLCFTTYNMAPVKCYYHDCINTNATKSMFSFPVNDELHLNLWIKHSGNTNLASLTPDELKHRFICEDHFQVEDILKHEKRSRLVHAAIPLKYTPITGQCVEMSSPEHLKVKTPQRVYERRRIDLPMHSDPSPSTSMLDAPIHTSVGLKRRRLFDDDQDHPEVKRLKKEVAVLKKKNRDQLDKIRRLSAKDSKKKKMIFFESLPFQSGAAKTIAAMQLRKTNSRKEWTKTEKELCLSIYYKSPATYMHMRRQGIVLAGPSTIRKWLGQTNCLPGMQKDVCYNVEQRFQNSPMHEKACVIAFDEMSIMSSLEYSKKYDQIEGFQDLGRGQRAPLIAKYVLVFLVRGLYSRWKLPMAYFLSAGNVTADILSLLIKVIINKLFDIGLLPKAIVSDQISTNRKAFKGLGVSVRFPFFHCNGRKIFAFFDIPHALKNIRNNFLDSDFTDGTKIFSFRDVISTYEIDKKNKSKCLTKLTPVHLKPNNFQKMKVSLAAQVLSRSVAVAIKTVLGTGELKSVTALDTANFILTINNAFDALNSKKPNSKNPCNRALSKNLNQTRQALLDGKKVLTNLKKILKKKNGSTIFTRPPSFDGFVQSIEAVMQMFDEESSGDVKYILTGRLNQDVLENLFAIYRSKAGFNKNPSARVLRTIFRSNLVNSLMKAPENKNCANDDDTYVENAAFAEPTDPTEEKENQFNEETEEAPQTSSRNLNEETMMHELQNSQDGSQQPRTVTLEECSIVYFAGYLAKKCIEKYQCDGCRAKLTKGDELTDTNQLLIINKAYPSIHATKLIAPSEALVNLTDACLTIFKEYFESMKHIKNVRTKLYDCVKKNIPQYDICAEHEEFIIMHLLLVKIHDYCKSHKKNVLENKMHSKLRILKNL